MPAAAMSAPGRRILCRGPGILLMLGAAIARLARLQSR